MSDDPGIELGLTVRGRARSRGRGRGRGRCFVVPGDISGCCTAVLRKQLGVRVRVRACHMARLVHNAHLRDRLPDLLHLRGRGRMRVRRSLRV